MYVLVHLLYCNESRGTQVYFTAQRLKVIKKVLFCNIFILCKYFAIPLQYLAIICKYFAILRNTSQYFAILHNISQYFAISIVKHWKVF